MKKPALNGIESAKASQMIYLDRMVILTKKQERNERAKQKQYYEHAKENARKIFE